MRWTILTSALGRPTTVVGLSCVAVCAGIALNALWLQSGRHHPAPLFSTRAAVSDPTPPRPDDLVRAIQAGLGEAGVYSGSIDGLYGPQTAAAIAAFQERNGLASTARTSPELLAAILDENGKAARLARTKPAPTVENLIARVGTDTASIAAVQRALSAAAYGPINLDGVFGRQTREAIMRFQADHGLPVTGEISDGLMVELRSAGALAGG